MMKTLREKAEEILFGAKPDAWVDAFRAGATQMGRDYVVRKIADLRKGEALYCMGYNLADYRESGSWTVLDLERDLEKIAKANNLHSFKIHNERAPLIFISKKEFNDVLVPFLRKEKSIKVVPRTLQEKEFEDINEMAENLVLDSDEREYAWSYEYSDSNDSDSDDSDTELSLGFQFKQSQ